ncbi:retroviral-like aspartic protease family protein [Chitinophaga sp.]|uniref:retroviral-like aspartic protease family protein n=1 Tax=Chitinophaga sp. TaxID=1869181 RepID=UPI002F95DB97
MRFLTLLFLLVAGGASAQFASVDAYIRSREGNRVWEKNTMIWRCVKAMKADASNKEVVQICTCQAELIDRHFPMKQIKQYDRLYAGDALNKLIEGDSALQASIEQCYKEISQANLFFSPGQMMAYRDSMVAYIRSNKKEPLDESRINSYCDCAVAIMARRKINMQTIEDMNDPNSMLFNEIAYSCGGFPYKKISPTRGWSVSDSLDVTGASGVDAVDVITISGMTKLKVKIGPVVNVWMLDCGATDMLVSDTMINKLLQLKLVSKSDFLGQQTYNLANGKEILCDVYRINHVQVGKFIVNNLIIGASKETGSFLLGKTFLNKFRRWSLDNQRNQLILER